ncbi:MAG: uroporphyrinogen-III synthase, partial [Caulobacteraceae bacterium]|nr:uroporphyrinogen-III synthase [Caulobacteraceae bacterium]
MKRVWIARSAPGALQMGAEVRALGFEAVVAPLLEARSVGSGPIDLSGVAALAFTSGHAVRAFAARSPERGLPVFAVGAATAREAKRAGF